MTAVVSRGRFDNRQWRDILAEAAYEIDKDRLGLEVISPFGFEVLNDRAFLQKPLRRFFCYIGCMHHLPSERQKALEIEFLQAVYARLQRYDPHFADTFVVLVTYSRDRIKLRENDYVCQKDDSFLRVEYRHVVSADLLSDYCHYIVTSIAGFSTRTLPVFKRVQEARMAWLYLFQLYVMYQHLFKSWYTVAELGQDVKRRNLVLQGDDLQNYFDEQYAGSHYCEADLDFIVGEVSKLRTRITKQLAEDDSTINLSGKAYHGETLLCMEVSETVYRNVFQSIYESYVDCL